MLGRLDKYPRRARAGDFGEMSVKFFSTGAQKHLDRTRFFLSWNLIRILQNEEKLQIGRCATKILPGRR